MPRKNKDAVFPTLHMGSVIGSGVMTSSQLMSPRLRFCTLYSVMGAPPSLGGGFQERLAPSAVISSTSGLPGASGTSGQERATQSHLLLLLV